MIRSIQQPLLLAAGLFAAGLFDLPLAYADPTPPPAGWMGQGQAGLVVARGTLDTTTANAKLDATDTIGDWKDIAHLAFLYGESATDFRVLLSVTLALLATAAAAAFIPARRATRVDPAVALRNL